VGVTAGNVSARTAGVSQVGGGSFGSHYEEKERKIE
jgi:hypothetical protein